MTTKQSEIVNRIVSAAPELSTLDLGPSDYSLGDMVDLRISDGTTPTYERALENRGDFGRSVGQTTADLAGDIFWHMYDGDPPKLKEPPPTRQVNAKLLDWMLDSPGFQEAVEETQFDLPTSIASSQLLFNHITQEEVVQEALRDQEEAEQFRRDSQEARLMADGYEKAGDEAAASYWAAADDLEAEAKRIMEIANRRLENVKDDPAMKALVSAAARAAGEEAQKISRVMVGFGLGSGSNIQDNAEEALALLKAIGGDVAKIAELAGRFKGFAMTTIKEKIQRGPVAQSVGLTKDILRVFPTERVYLAPSAPPVMRAMKVAAFVTEGLLGWTPSGEGEKAGPFVAAVDFSPSMWGDRLIVAKAVALGLAMTAKEQGREYIIFCFASDKTAIRTVTSADGWREHIEWANAKTSGGTDFDMAMEYASEQLSRLGHPDNADLMFLSDGEGRMSDDHIEEFNRYRELHGTKMYYVPCHRGRGGPLTAWEESGSFNVEDVADEVVYVEDLDSQGGAEIAQHIAAEW